MYTTQKHWGYHEVIDHETLDKIAAKATELRFLKGIVHTPSDLPVAGADGDTYFVLSEKVFYTFGTSENGWLPPTTASTPTSIGVVYDTSNTDHIQTVTEQYSTMQVVYTPTYDANDYVTSIQIDIKSADGGTTYSTTTLAITNNIDGNITNIS